MPLKNGNDKSMRKVFILWRLIDVYPQWIKIYFDTRYFVLPCFVPKWRQHFQSNKPSWGTKTNIKTEDTRVVKFVSFRKSLIFSTVLCFFWRCLLYHLRSIFYIDSIGILNQISVIMAKTRNSQMIELLADKQWRRFFIPRLDHSKDRKSTKYIKRKIFSELIVANGGFVSFFFNYITYLFNQKKKYYFTPVGNIIMCYNAHSHRQFNELYGMTCVHSLHDLSKTKQNITPHYNTVLLCSRTTRNNFLVCICLALWCHCVICELWRRQLDWTLSTDVKNVQLAQCVKTHRSVSTFERLCVD